MILKTSTIQKFKNLSLVAIKVRLLTSEYLKSMNRWVELREASQPMRELQWKAFRREGFSRARAG